MIGSGCSHVRGLLISPKWCVASCGPEKWLWDAREAGESAFAVAFVCFQESISQPRMSKAELLGAVLYHSVFLNVLV